MKSALIGATLFAPGQIDRPRAPPACKITEGVKRVEIDRYGTFGQALVDAGAGPLPAEEIRRRLRRLYDLRNVHRGDQLDLGMTQSGELAWLRYRPSLTAAVCITRQGRHEWGVRYLSLPVERDVDLLTLEGSPSLAVAIEELGEDPSLERRLEELFPSVAIDSARVLVERLSVEGEFLSYPRILAAEITAAGKTQRAFYFQHPDGLGGYYTDEGVALSALPLASPVPDEGIVVSGYGWRRHPIRRVRRPHKGIDYSAPRETLVNAVANGTVVQARYWGPLGRMVVIDHGQGLVTRYAHLNRYVPGIREGVRVRRGQPIGRIGTSGLTTGAHLHFETIVDDRHVNPRRVKTPPAPPISVDLLPAFSEQVERLLEQLEVTFREGDA